MAEETEQTNQQQAAADESNNKNTANQGNESIDSLLKKILYQGIAKANAAKEYVEKAVNGLIGENKVSNEEGKKIVNNFTSGIDSKMKDMEAKIRETISNAIQNVRPATKSEVEELKKRVEALEKIVAGLD
ncbi:MAG: hypothetical protein MJZ66_05900 [Bacteroidales bacterium]|nr:hypothetical protein [Bacteroidales bacterium]